MTALDYQPSLLDLDETAPRLGTLPAPSARRWLSRGAWGDYAPGWVVDSDDVFTVLLEGGDWRAERGVMWDTELPVPRLLRGYGGDEPLPHPLLIQARD